MTAAPTCPVCSEHLVDSQWRGPEVPSPGTMPFRGEFKSCSCCSRAAGEHVFLRWTGFGHAPSRDTSTHAGIENTCSRCRHSHDHQTTSTVGTSLHAEVDGFSSGVVASGPSYRRADENPQTEQREPFEVDPDAIDRALGGHARTQNAVAEFIESKGFRPVSPGPGDPPIDVGWWDGETFHVAEVKSLSPSNETGQLRLGLGQVLDYADAVRRSGRDVQPFLVVEGEPTDARWTELCGAVGVTLAWPGQLDRLLR